MVYAHINDIIEPPFGVLLGDYESLVIQGSHATVQLVRVEPANSIDLL